MADESLTITWQNKPITIMGYHPNRTFTVDTYEFLLLVWHCQKRKILPRSLRRIYGLIGVSAALHIQKITFHSPMDYGVPETVVEEEGFDFKGHVRICHDEGMVYIKGGSRACVRPIRISASGPLFRSRKD